MPPRPEARRAKKEETSDTEDDEETSDADKSKQKSRNKNAPLKSQSGAKRAKKEDGGEASEQPTSKKTVTTKTEVVETKQVKKRGPDGASKEGKKIERKVYDLPGQKRDPPEERDPLRIFYETLYEQAPQSEMAAVWMMEAGLLSREEAMKVYERKQKEKLRSAKTTVIEKKKDSISITKKSGESQVRKMKAESKTVASSRQAKKRRSKDESSSSDEEVVRKTKRAKF